MAHSRRGILVYSTITIVNTRHVVTLVRSDTKRSLLTIAALHAIAGADCRE
jgi:hypothetical protein